MSKKKNTTAKQQREKCYANRENITFPFHISATQTSWQRSHSPSCNLT